MDKKLKVLLYRSFDSDLSPQDKRLLEEALSQSEEFRKEREMIISLRKKLQQGKVTSFKPFFADRVMAKIRYSKRLDEKEQFFESLFVIFRPITIAAAILIIIIAGYNITSTGKFSFEGALGIPDVTVNEVYDPTLALLTEE
jgi:hypothetical protein